MAEHLIHKYETDGAVTKSDVREELSKITEEDVSESSPLTAGAPEVGIETPGPGNDHLTVRVEGHDGEWTKTSEKTLRRGVKRADGVGDLVSSEGGYEPED